MNPFNNWATVIELIRAHRDDGHHLRPVESTATAYPGIHLGVNDPAFDDKPICDAFDESTARPSGKPADCIVCKALAREALGIDQAEPELPALGRNVWKLKTFNNRVREWQTKRVGGEEALSQMLTDLFRWKAEGQEVRLEWSELN